MAASPGPNHDAVGCLQNGLYTSSNMWLFRKRDEAGCGWHDYTKSTKYIWEPLLARLLLSLRNATTQARRLIAAEDFEIRNAQIVRSGFSQLSPILRRVDVIAQSSWPFLKRLH